MIFIAYNFDGYIISIVNAKNKELANAYWQGADIVPYSIKSLEKDFSSLEDHPTGVFSILKTQEVDGFKLSEYNNNKDKTYIFVSK